MARRVKDAQLDTRSARERLAPKHEPYWRLISEGRHIGYRKGKVKRGKTPKGKWIARAYTTNGYRKWVLGEADDIADADGKNVLTFAQAQEAAHERFKSLTAGNVAAGPYTVKAAIEGYMADYTARSGKGTSRYEYFVNAHILPNLGDIEVSDLTLERITRWHRGLARTPARLRTRKGAPQNYREVSDDPDAQRRRRATANRVLAILKAGLNFALAQGKVQCDGRAWREARPFKGVDAAKIRYLKDDEVTRLVNACQPDLRQIVTAALLTGSRYGELTRVRVEDFDSDARILHVTEAKGGRPRVNYLTDEGVRFFENATFGKEHGDLIFRKASGTKWKHANQFRPLKEACEAAYIRPAVSFHVLRHTHGSRLAMKGVPMAVIAAQLGHADTRMTERHYAHLSPSFVADTVRAALGSLGIVEEDNVTPLRGSSSR